VAPPIRILPTPSPRSRSPHGEEEEGHNRPEQPVPRSNSQIEPYEFAREAETVQGNLEPGFPNDLVDREGEIYEDIPTPQIKLQPTGAVQKKAKKKGG